MKPGQTRRNTRAFTRGELLVVVVVLALLAALLLPALAQARNKATRTRCVINLKQIGFAHRVFANDHTNPAGLGSYTMTLATNRGGTLEYVGKGAAFKHYLNMSNEVGSAKLLACPADASRTERLTFVGLSNSNVSYFVGLETDETRPMLPLAGDRSMTNGWPLHNGIMEITPSRPAVWTTQLHGVGGNIVFSDGSVSGWNSQMLSNYSSGLMPSAGGFAPYTSGPTTFTNRLEFP